MCSVRACADDDELNSSDEKSVGLQPGAPVETVRAQPSPQQTRGARHNDAHMLDFEVAEHDDEDEDEDDEQKEEDDRGNDDDEEDYDDDGAHSNTSHTSTPSHWPLNDQQLSMLLHDGMRCFYRAVDVSMHERSRIDRTVMLCMCDGLVCDSG